MTDLGTGDDRDARLARRFVSLADTLVDDFDVADLLDQLTEACVELLGVTTAGLLILDAAGQLHPVAASSDAIQVLELFQLQNDEGPCLDCVRTGMPVAVPEIWAASARWPRFSEATSEGGFGSVVALPMRLRNETIGSLNLFNAVGRAPLAAGEQEVAQALADVATIGIVQQRTIERSSLLAEQLQRALETRIVIEQAKGILVEFGGVDVDRAFAALRHHARAHHLKLGDVAAALVSGGLEPGRVITPRSG